MSESQNVLIDSVAYAFGPRRVLDSVSFVIVPGRVTLLLGPNGAGKTTLFSLIAGLLAPQSGQITVPRKSMSIVFQQPALDLDLTVQQNLHYHAGLYGLRKSEAETRLVPLLIQLDLESRRQEKVRDLNGGHRRRVEIVRALMTEPSLLLLDEPTAGLDAPTRKSLVDFLHNIAKHKNLSMLWATHMTDEAAAEDDVIILHQGKIKAHANFKNVIKQAKAKSLEDAFNILTKADAV